MITLDLNYDGTFFFGQRPEEIADEFRIHHPLALALATYGYGHETLRRLRDVTKVSLGLLLDPFGHASERSEHQPIEWLAECLTPLLDERLIRYCGLSCTVPSIEYVEAISRLVADRES